MNEDEEWRPLLGYEGLYEVSSFGRVKRLQKTIDYGKFRVTVQEIIKKPSLNKGYHHVGLRKERATITRSVHQCVARAFIGPPPTPRHEINHKNGVRNDNRVENLEWVTHSENLTHAFRVLKARRADFAIGEKHHSARLTDVQVVVMRQEYALNGGTYAFYARRYGLKHTNAMQLLKREKRKNAAILAGMVEIAP